MDQLVIGIDHIYITVSDLAHSERFYDRVMSILGFRKSRTPIAGDEHAHYYCRHFGFSLRPARVDSIHDPYSPGLHHFCFRVEGMTDVDAVYDRLVAEEIEASAPRLYPEYAPDYYATFFADPDGIRLEVTNYREQRRRHLERWDDL